MRDIHRKQEHWDPGEASQCISLSFNSTRLKGATHACNACPQRFEVKSGSHRDKNQDVSMSVVLSESLELTLSFLRF